VSGSPHLLETALSWQVGLRLPGTGYLVVELKVSTTKATHGLATRGRYLYYPASRIGRNDAKLRIIPSDSLRTNQG